MSLFHEMTEMSVGNVKMVRPVRQGLLLLMAFARPSEFGSRNAFLYFSFLFCSFRSESSLSMFS